MKNVNLIEHPLILHKLTLMRNKETKSGMFRTLLREISQLMLYEITRDLPLKMKSIETPLCKMEAPTLSGKNLVLASILRAGNGFLEGMLDLVPHAKVAHIGLYRDHDTLEAVEYYYKAPPSMDERLVIVVDPMLATGNTVCTALSKLKSDGAKDIKYVCLLAVEQGIAHINEAHPDIPIYTCAIDEGGLNEVGYIVPGIGDAGDRIYGTK